MPDEASEIVCADLTFQENDKERAAVARILFLAGVFNSDGDVIQSGKRLRRAIRAAAMAAKVSPMQVMDWMSNEEFIDYVTSFDLRQSVKLFTAVTRRGLRGDISAAKYAMTVLNPERYDSQLVRERKKEGWLEDKGLLKAGDVTNNLVIAIQSMGNNPLAKKLLESANVEVEALEKEDE